MLAHPQPPGASRAPPLLSPRGRQQLRDAVRAQGPAPAPAAAAAHAAAPPDPLVLGDCLATDSACQLFVGALFDGSTAAAQRFFAQMLRSPLLICTLQHPFYDQLAAAGCFELASAALSAAPTMNVLYLDLESAAGADYGDKAYDLRAFLSNFCAALLGRPAPGEAAAPGQLRPVERIDAVPREIALTFLFFEDDMHDDQRLVHRLRRYFIERLLTPAGNDYRLWDATLRCRDEGQQMPLAAAIFCTADFMALMYLREQFAACNPALLPASSKLALARAMASSSSVVYERAGARALLQRTSSVASPTLVFAFFLFFVQRMALCMPDALLANSGLQGCYRAASR